MKVGKDNSLLKDLISALFSEAVVGVDIYYKNHPFEALPTRMEVEVIRNGFDLLVEVRCYRDEDVND